MKKINTYLLEKFKINKNTKSIDINEVFLSLFKTSKVNFTEKFISCLEEWLNKNEFVKLNVSARNFKYIGKLDNEDEIKDSILIFDESRRMNRAYTKYFGEEYHHYHVYSDSIKNQEIYINDNALYFNCYYDKSGADPWIEVVIVGEK